MKLFFVPINCCLFPIFRKKTTPTRKNIFMKYIPIPNTFCAKNNTSNKFQIQILLNRFSHRGFFYIFNSENASFFFVQFLWFSKFVGWFFKQFFVPICHLTRIYAQRQQKFHLIVVRFEKIVLKCSKLKVFCCLFGSDGRIGSLKFI